MNITVVSRLICGTVETEGKKINLQLAQKVLDEHGIDSHFTDGFSSALFIELDGGTVSLFSSGKLTQNGPLTNRKIYKLQKFLEREVLKECLY